MNKVILLALLCILLVVAFGVEEVECQRGGRGGGGRGGGGRGRGQFVNGLSNLLINNYFRWRWSWWTRRRQRWWWSW